MAEDISRLLIIFCLMIATRNLYATPTLWAKLKKDIFNYMHPIPSSEFEAKSSPGEISLIGDRKCIFPQGADSIGYYKVRHLLASSEATKKTKTENGWSKTRHSGNISVGENRLNLERGKTAKQTDVCVGEKDYGTGTHLWEVHWPKEQRGTHAVIGIIAGEGTPLSGIGYKNIIGSDKYSYGWDMKNNKIIHDGKVLKDYPEQSLGYVAPEEMLLILDMDQGCLSFVDKGTGEFLGRAVTGLKGRQCSPAISAVWACCKIALHYVAGVGSDPLNLQELCKVSIYKEFGKKDLEKVPRKSDLPKSLQQFLSECNNLKIEVKDGFE